MARVDQHRQDVVALLGGARGAGRSARRSSRPPPHGCARTAPTPCRAAGTESSRPGAAARFSSSLRRCRSPSSCGPASRPNTARRITSSVSAWKRGCSSIGLPGRPRRCLLVGDLLHGAGQPLHLLAVEGGQHQLALAEVVALVEQDHRVLADHRLEDARALTGVQHLRVGGEDLLDLRGVGDHHERRRLQQPDREPLAVAARGTAPGTRPVVPTRRWSASRSAGAGPAAALLVLALLVPPPEAYPVSGARPRADGHRAGVAIRRSACPPCRPGGGPAPSRSTCTRRPRACASVGVLPFADHVRLGDFLPVLLEHEVVGRRGLVREFEGGPARRGGEAASARIASAPPGSAATCTVSPAPPPVVVSSSVVVGRRRLGGRVRVVVAPAAGGQPEDGHRTDDDQ